MTNKDIMVQILHEVSGKPKEFVASMFEEIAGNLPNSTKLQEEVPVDKAEELLEALRKEKAGILNWLLKGRQDMIDKLMSK